MIIWLLLLIPLFAVIVLLVFWSKKLAWWEIVVLVMVSVGLIFLMKIIGTTYLTRDTEYWGDLVERAEYYQEYKIWDHETCYHDVPCGTDSKGNTKYCSESYDCSHADYYPAHWEIVTVSGWHLSISNELWAIIVKKFNVLPVFQDMNREANLGVGDYMMQDGNMYYVSWNKTSETSHFVAQTHHYENRVQCSKSLFNKRDVSKEEIQKNKLFEYPSVDKNHDVSTILGNNIPNQIKAEQKFKFLNGALGPKKQVRVWILLFRNQPLSTGVLQETYWKRGNMNEFVVTIGLDNSNNVQWCHPFSWTTEGSISVETRDFVMKQGKLDLEGLADFLYKELDVKWKRRDFKKEFSYISVEPPLWAIILAFVLNIIFCSVWGWWSVTNQFTFKKPKGEEYY